jgi:hypothetical protein
MILKRKPPKAYRAYEKDGDCATIVFAESATKAKAAAQATDCCEDAQYIDIRVQRMPGADKLYKGYSEIDWYDKDTRISLVRDFGWSCLDPSWECDTCPAKPYCHRHEPEVEP